MGEELSSQDAAKAQDMVAALREDEGRQVTLLLHTIPWQVLRSIAMRMVAFDFWKRDSDNCALLYDKEGPGVYIAIISVVNRQGTPTLEYLNVAELVEKFDKKNKLTMEELKLRDEKEDDEFIVAELTRGT
ncbi:hypothetical protein GL218_06431 [Daldinia childiae]|uniref:uncharacterized protein n=1 Tax=Daldinia childiae TaxID=326645 RepID=UPI001447B160|nr:uncharacterized protein GL218_06431 [Daldinia childiae]KAF3056452.1 hypothetical protein GL218_06431 [Daldinia childiae]